MYDGWFTLKGVFGVELRRSSPSGKRSFDTLDSTCLTCYAGKCVKNM